MFKKISLKIKMMLGVLMSCLIFTGIIGFNIYNQKKLARLQDEGFQRVNDFEKVQMANKYLLNIYPVIGDAVINRQLEETEKSIRELYEEKEKAFAILNEVPDTDEEKALAEQIKNDWLRYLELFKNDFMAEVRKSEDITPKIRQLDGELDQIRNRIIVAMDKIVSSLNAEAIEGDKQFKTIAQSTFEFSVFSTIIFSFLIIIVLLYFVSALMKSLQSIASSVDTAGIQVASASEQLAKASEQLSSGSQQQASALEETSASLTEITGMAQSNVKGAEQAEDITKEVYDISENAQESMDQLAAAMQSILQSNARIENLVKVIHQVGEKTQVIDDIVFKTQLLSFNASVEAERAGEHGRGFAVVAQEVGNLAQLSGKAALEISSIVKNSIKEAETVATENKNSVVFGEKLATVTKEKVGSALNKLKIVQENVSKIVGASKEQEAGMSQISTSVESISQLTQQNASTAEETASSSSELSGQAESLLSTVSNLKSLIYGEGQDSESQPKIKLAKENKKSSVQKPILSVVHSEKLSGLTDKPSQLTDQSASSWDRL